MTARQRLALLLIALAGATALTWWSGRTDEAPALAVVRRNVAPAAPAAATPPGKALAVLQPRGRLDGGNPFRSAGWEPTPAPATLLPPPAPPQAPPLPFRLLGRYVDGERQSFFLQYGERNVVATVGDVIDETYRLVSFEQGVLNFNYLPLDIDQTLAVGEQN
ncbi:hypothetical protein N8I74_18185 [Chitiniphilus purpureus]|uniref:Secretion system X translation initiation factor n=1 Tax=Chitiniphilus purpureus TaxID=2981137 RepID=A0ABY6DQ56_9NEIS|nr:hypothetical protein [Chitiniphilus sp. CD1]UXY15216.1 hypothetical protein N8I74_18185 [Chitiniphilus sp. CD1]